MTDTALNCNFETTEKRNQWF